MRVVFFVGAGSTGAARLAGIITQLDAARRQLPDAGDPTRLVVLGPAEVGSIHRAELARHRMSGGDARPAASTRLATSGVSPATSEAMAARLAALAASPGDAVDLVIVHDPHLPWFAHAWHTASRAAGATPMFVLMARKPAGAVRDDVPWYGGTRPWADRVAGWVTMTAHAEAATRGDRRLVVPFEDVIQDWLGGIGRIDRYFDLGLLRGLSPDQLTQLSEAVGPSVLPILAEERRRLTRTLPASVPEELTHLARRLDVALRDLAAEPEWSDAERFDEIRADAARGYRQAEAWCHSTIAALTAERDAALAVRPSLTAAVRAAIPHRVRALIPGPIRRALRRLPGAGEVGDPGEPVGPDVAAEPAEPAKPAEPAGPNASSLAPTPDPDRPEET